MVPVASASWTCVSPRALQSAARRGPKLASSFFLRGISWAIVKPESQMNQAALQCTHSVYSHGRYILVNGPWKKGKRLTRRIGSRARATC